MIDNKEEESINDFIGLFGPARVAMRDISEYLRNQNLLIFDENDDVWVVTPERMNNKETRKLNKELGLHKINMNSKRMNRSKHNLK